MIQEVAAGRASPSDRVEKKGHISVAVVGGGIAGVALASGLARYAHLDVSLYESAQRFGEVGAGVSFGPNAVRAVAGLGLEREYAALADRTPAPWQDVWFDWRFAADDRYITSTLAPPTGQSSVHRAEFLELLVKRLPAGMATFSRRATGVEQDADRATVSFADGTTAIADVVFACDGIRSALRADVLAGRGAMPAQPEWSGTRAYRGMVSSAALRQTFRERHLDARMIDVPQMFLAPNAHVLTFPVRRGEMVNIVAFTTAAEPGVSWPDDTPWVRDATQEAMLADFSMCGEAVSAILAHIERPTVWALHDVPPIKHYVHGRVALVGDAAHAMLPHQGAGAGQGLEDAYFLTRLLADPRITTDDLPSLLAAYEAVRLPRASAVQRTSRDAGLLYELAAGGIGADETRLREALESRFAWIWDHDLDADIRTAAERMDGRLRMA